MLLHMLHMLQDAPAPDVWLKLLEQCAVAAGWPPMLATTLRILAEQLAQERALNAKLRQKLSAEQQRVAAQEQQIVAQQQKIDSLQEQLQALHAGVQQLLPPHRQ